jgi:hypothetical protein
LEDGIRRVADIGSIKDGDFTFGNAAWRMTNMRDALRQILKGDFEHLASIEKYLKANDPE